MTHPHHRRRLAARVRSQGGFSAGHSGLGLLDRGEHVFTEIQAFPLRHAPSREYPSWRT
jgi:hypothetical protein